MIRRLCDLPECEEPAIAQLLTVPIPGVTKYAVGMALCQEHLLDGDAAQNMAECFAGMNGLVEPSALTSDQLDVIAKVQEHIDDR